jgi:hypothetical protein
MKAAEVPSGKISATASGDESVTLWAGIYRGRKPAKVTLSVGERNVSARIVTLPRNPGWAAFYADDTSVEAKASHAIVTIEGADGAVLASLTKPRQS